MEDLDVSLGQNAITYHHEVLSSSIPDQDYPMDVNSSSESNVMSESCKIFANSDAFLAGTIQDSSSLNFTIGGISNSSPSALGEGDRSFAEDGQFALGYVHSSYSQRGFLLALSVIHGASMSNTGSYVDGRVLQSSDN
ncbi:hypothetical protein ARMGADRAFT_1039563 [Armillaria gallica]|uniref:Uncharacterized protein n=1 Tax=Armillaria gallica TaxID=47427 RepID=A0A2H3CDA1_ARMGA|nr:hypothetical protein ARMGADRAFT_1039563 [Armillaria gallica]